MRAGGGASASGPRKENKGVHNIKNQPLAVTFTEQAQNMSRQRERCYVEDAQAQLPMKSSVVAYPPSCILTPEQP